VPQCPMESASLFVANYLAVGCAWLNGGLHVARWRSGQGVGLATGDSGCNPSRCAVECDLGLVVHTHCPAPLKLRPYGAISRKICTNESRLIKIRLLIG